MGKKKRKKEGRERKENSRPHRVKRGKGVILLEILYVLAAAALVVMTLIMDVLPEKYLIIALVALGTVTLVIFWFFHSGRKKVITAGIIISILFIILYGLGCYYFINTFGFFRSITAGVETRDYYVLTTEDTGISSAEDIEGQEILVLSNATECDIEAMAQLDEKAKVTYAEADSYIDIADRLIEGEAQLAMLSAEYVEMVDEEESHEGFADTVKTLDTITVKMESTPDNSDIDVTKDSFIVYLTGIDTEGTVSAQARSDVNMLAVVNPTTKKVLLVSIPRDYYVRLHTAGQLDKLTHTGIYGVEETMATIEDLYGIDINYYVKINFTGTRNMIDAIDGIDIVSDYAFVTTKGGYYITAGEQHLNGDQALSFARERKHVPGGDNQRIKDQQIVIEAVINKVTQSETILKSYNKLLASMEDNLATSMSEKEMTSLVKMQLKDMADWDITKISASGEGTKGPCYSSNGLYAYVMEPDPESIAEITTAIEQAVNDAEVLDEENLEWYQKAWYWVLDLFDGSDE